MSVKKRKKRTKKQIHLAVKKAAGSHGGACLTETYRPISQPWSFRCRNNHYFERPARSVLSGGAWCPRCLKRTPEEMLKKIRSVAHERGGQCLSERYAKRPKKMIFECAEGHRWKALGSHILYAGNWCPTCAEQPSNEFLDRFERRLEELGGTMVRKRLGRLSEPHLFVCAKGHRFTQTPSKFLSAGHWCPTCSYEERGEMHRLGIDAARRYAKEMGGECLESAYVNGNQKAWWRCAEGHEWQAVFKSVIYNGTWCPECWNEMKRAGLNRDGKFVMRHLPRKLGLEFCQEYAEERGGRCISIEYEGYTAYLEWVCDNGHEWEASLHNMEQRENFCLECAEIERKAEWLHTAKEFARENGGLCLSTEWRSAQSKLKWRCANGHEFKTSWNNAIVPPFCGQCAKEAAYQEDGAKRLHALAKKNGGRWIECRYTGLRSRYTFECRNGCRFTTTPQTAERSWLRYCQCPAALKAS
jgi:hypothetical protein